jgi:uncharacterized BrkB/YihY/UPF0761 family membrane protein
MSTATRVPETHQLEGDDALNALRRTGWGPLAKDSFQRFRAADGFSHARALAFQITFTLLPAIIAVVGLATILHAAKFRDILRHTVTRLAPGPAGDIVVAAFKQGERTVGGGARAALLFGAVATLISAATAMGQVERGANRIYGVEQDRPPQAAAARRVLAGRRLGAVGTALICVHRPARAVSWPEHDLRADLRPMAGMIGILAWALLTSLAAFLGLAFAAQLEAVRAGVPRPATGQQANSRGRARRRRVALR